MTIHTMTAVEIKTAYSEGALSRREVVEALLARIDAVNHATNGIIYRFDERALGEAEVGDRVGEDGERGLLDGIPVLVSDWYAIEGVPRAMGVKAWADEKSDADDALVRRLRAAGAIIIAKTAVPEFYVRWNSVSELFGETLNARDLTCSAGGSGGGAATSVAAGIAPIAFHADLGGSVRLPATFCGVTGIRPTSGVVPLVYTFEPSLAFEELTALGPIARSIDDAWLALRAVAGPEPSLPKTAPLALPSTLNTSAPLPRVARLVEATGAEVDPEIVQEIDRTADALGGAGYEVVDSAPPQLARLADLWIQLVGTELMHCVMPDVRGTIGESARQHIDTLYGQFDLGPELKPYLDAERELRAVAREVSLWMDTYPLVLAPVTGMPRPPIDFDYFLSAADNLALFDRMRCLVWVNALGLPGVALGNGAQIVGRRFHDHETAAAAASALAALGPIEVADP